MRHILDIFITFNYLGFCVNDLFSLYKQRGLDLFWLCGRRDTKNKDLIKARQCP